MIPLFVPSASEHDFASLDPLAYAQAKGVQGASVFYDPHGVDILNAAGAVIARIDLSGGGQ